MKQFIESEKRKRHFSLLLFCISFMTIGHVRAQISGSNVVCKNDTKTYTYDGLKSSCPLTWSVVGGVFPDYSSGTSQALTTGSDDKSTIKVKWTDDASGTLSVSTNCTAGNSDIDVTINSVNFSVTSNPTTVQLGGQVTLTATADFYTPDYAWTCPPTGNLNQATGAVVTALPSATTIYTCTGTVIFFNGNVQSTCSQDKTITINVDIPPFTGNVVCCNQCISSGSSPGQLSQDAGSSLGGGNGTPFLYQWQKSNDGVSFSNVSGATASSYSPGAMTQTTWFRRLVSESNVPASTSNIVSVEVIPTTPQAIGAATYATNTTKKSFGAITIQGNQTPASGVQVNFRSSSQVLVKSNSIIYPNVLLSSILNCGVPNGRFANQEVEQETTYDNNITAFPNPTNGETTLRYKMSKSGNAKIYVTDLMGNVIKILRSAEYLDSGDHELTFNTSEMDSGLYFFVLETNWARRSGRLIVIK